MTFRLTVAAIVVLAWLSQPGTSAQAQTRHALVIGIDDYRDVPKLGRAVADARAMRDTLQSLGFRTRFAENPDRNAMSAAIAGLEDSIEKGDTAFLFFAGHGVEIAGQNVLLPADVPDPGRASQGILRDAGFNTSALIERITERGARSAFFVFDACRDNPYAKAGNTRSVGSARGLGRAEAPEGVFVLMSAGLNQQALDSLNLPDRPQTDTSANSVFTRVLLEELAKPGLTHIVLAKAVQTRVRDLARSVDHAQVPAFYDQIIGDVILRPGGAAPAPGPIAVPLPQTAAVTPVQPTPPAPSAASGARDLGARLNVSEMSANGTIHNGTWTRIGPRSYRAEWRMVGSNHTVSDVIDVESERGDSFVLHRRQLNGRYFGTLSPDGRVIWGHASWYGTGDRWAAEIQPNTVPASAARGDIKTPAAPSLAPAARWHMQELSASGDVYDGVLTRNGARSFRAEWRLLPNGAPFTDTIEIEQQFGNVVVLYRKSLKGRYYGTLSNDGRFLQGYASWYRPGDRWTAQSR